MSEKRRPGRPRKRLGSKIVQARRAARQGDLIGWVRLKWEMLGIIAEREDVEDWLPAQDQDRLRRVMARFAG